ncbi:serine/threonine protein kinase [Conyzicola lurida]|uniref:Serine/threonine protein kinase n=1 Tax=Conyzicola lurida TaxID=1172621 RepID=A0A841AKN1_9MICO|nr:serine/threonine-protein kinase [Conyzicola lurida]MBB5842009.1 serine/threonine protein kinase [Conyzicola lurida]
MGDDTVTTAEEKPELDAPLLSERYQPLQLLARGGAALVYRGRDEILKRDVAIKLFAAGDKANMDQFRDEVRVLASLNHHGVVSISDVGIDRSSPDDIRPFLVMEFVHGSTVRRTVAERELSAREIAEIGFEVAEALEYVHSRGVIHRDISPANIMLTDYGTASSRVRARLTDFGIAIKADTVSDADAATLGTAAYLSPEQTFNEQLTPATDIYSLGLVMLECFTRTRAFPGNAMDSALLRRSEDPPIPASVPEPWAGLIGRMTRRDAAQRPSATQLLRDIRAGLRASTPPVADDRG